MSDEPPNDGPWGPPGRWASDQPPPGQVPAASTPSAPDTIRHAVKLMYVGAVLSLVGIPMVLMQRDEIRDQIREDNADLTADELDTAVNFGIGLAIFLALVGVGLWVWMAVKNGQGLSWARVVATVLGGLNIALTALGLIAGSAMGQSDSELTMALNLVSAVLAAAILFLLYQPASSDYYDRVTRSATTSGWSAY